MDTTQDLWLSAGIVAIALVLSAFFAGTETALTAASRARLAALEDAGDVRARLVNRILAARERFLGAMLLGRTLVMAGAAVFTTGVLATLFGKAGVLSALALLPVLVGLAEVVPRTLALAAPERAALLAARPALVATALLGPPALLAERAVREVLRRVGVRLAEAPSALTPREEIRDQMALLQREGGVAKAERDMLGGLLDLTELTVSEVMVHRTKMRAIDADLAPEAIVREVLASPYTRLPLWRGSPENIVGVLHAKDLLRALDAVGGDPGQLTIEAIALESWFVPDTTSLRDQLKAFLTRKTHFALVVDEYGEVMGLVTLEDILEEIVGDISDEHDVAVQGVRPQGDGSVTVDGAVPIRDLNRAMDWSLPDGEATTVAGLVIHEARAIPDAGQAFHFHGFRFLVLRKSRNRITALRLVRLGESGQPAAPGRQAGA
ncbi:hypothetical protein OPKNFCMD_2947 [Methylobacterium crusticola]|uniref:HlyC/CorC family transporter n=1 Tax=Methylobacterium crusticola TaxID=1697972 RepID=A0ABQ4QZB2_9HYPH|nr:HlyC/CorC family transporter [Methylobacterium crusticola]GJD50210.1 hypothetical protein OPKNFCMD_2947 [Methylobacterium crusticola]